MSNSKKENIVYCAVFPNGKRYIGITSYSLSTRISGHLSRVKAGSQLYFHNALRQYQEEVNWIVLEKCESFEQAKTLEQYYIKQFKSLWCEEGYNLTKGGDGTTGHRVTEETLRKLSDSHKGIKQSLETIEKRMQQVRGKITKKARKLAATNIITGEVTIYPSIMEAERNGFSRGSISHCCLGREKAHKGYTWKYVE